MENSSSRELHLPIATNIYDIFFWYTIDFDVWWRLTLYLSILSLYGRPWKNPSRPMSSLGYFVESIFEEMKEWTWLLKYSHFRKEETQWPTNLSTVELLNSRTSGRNEPFSCENYFARVLSILRHTEGINGASSSEYFTLKNKDSIPIDAYALKISISLFLTGESIKWTIRFHTESWVFSGSVDYT